MQLEFGRITKQIAWGVVYNRIGLDAEAPLVQLKG